MRNCCGSERQRVLANEKPKFVPTVKQGELTVRVMDSKGSWHWLVIPADLGCNLYNYDPTKEANDLLRQ